jgi:hypothetical protein
MMLLRTPAGMPAAHPAAAAKGAEYLLAAAAAPSGDLLLLGLSEGL